MGANTPQYQLRREVMTKKRMAWLDPCFSTWPGGLGTSPSALGQAGTSATPDGLPGRTQERQGREAPVVALGSLAHVPDLPHQRARPSGSPCSRHPSPLTLKNPRYLGLADVRVMDEFHLGEEAQGAGSQGQGAGAPPGRLTEEPLPLCLLVFQTTEAADTRYLALCYVFLRQCVILPLPRGESSSQRPFRAGLRRAP